MFNSMDLGADTLAKSMVSEPGETFTYNTGMVHLLSIALTKTSSMTTKQFAKKYLFEPLNMTEIEWSTDLQGFYNGGTLLSLRPRDMAKFGYLYLQKGKWQGEQIVPESWVEDSFKRYVTAEETYGYGYLFGCPSSRISRAIRYRSMRRAVMADSIFRSFRSGTP